MSDYFGNTDWKMQKLGKYSASECFKIFQRDKSGHIDSFGKDCMDYIKAKVAEELTLTPKDEINARSTNWGEMYEHEAYQYFEMVTGLRGTYYGKGNPIFFPYGDHAGCSPDWEIAGECGADFKCPYDSVKHLTNLSFLDSWAIKKAYPDYWHQLQMSIYIRKWKYAFWVSYDSRMIDERLKVKIIIVKQSSEWVEEFEYRLKLCIKEKERIIDILRNLKTDYASIMRPDIIGNAIHKDLPTEEQRNQARINIDQL